MKRTCLMFTYVKQHTLLLFSICCFAGNLSSQNPYTYDQVIKCDLQKQKADKTVPFDKSFILLIENSEIKNLKRVDAYQVDSKRDKVVYRKDASGAAVKDASFKFKVEKKDILVFVEPLKPGVEFVLHFVSDLDDKNRATFLEVGTLVKESKDTEADKLLTSLRGKIADKVTETLYFNVPDLTAFKRIYTSDLQTSFDKLYVDGNFPVKPAPTLEDLQAISVAMRKGDISTSEMHFLIKVDELSGMDDIQRGITGILKVYEKEPKVYKTDILKRVENINSNITYLDTLLIKINKARALNNESVVIGADTIVIEDVNTILVAMLKQMRSNATVLEEELKTINNNIDKRAEVKQAVSLTTGNKISDLKTESNNHFMLNAGFANIGARKLELGEGLSMIEYIPRLYWGISIYFRAVDKNTRRHSLPLKRELGIDPANSDLEKRRVGEILSHQSPWQYVALNVGLTTGSMKGDFDNFLNNTSLLIGPSVRVYRFVTLSSGVAVLRRSSFNPVVSEKKPVLGAYASIAFDIDVVEGVKDFINVLFK